MNNPPLTLTTITLNPSNPQTRAETKDLCRMHSRIIDVTTGMPDNGPRTLWAQPEQQTLTIRATHPITAARLPRHYTTGIHHQPWTIPTHPGQWLMAAVVNPGRNATTAGPTLNQPDRKRVNLQPRLYTEPDQQAAWLERRVDGATLIDWRITRAEIARGQHRTGRTITVRRIHIKAIWQVDDPSAMADRLTAGIGIDKTWGCGLSVWTPWTVR